MNLVAISPPTPCRFGKHPPAPKIKQPANEGRAAWAWCVVGGGVIGVLFSHWFPVVRRLLEVLRSACPGAPTGGGGDGGGWHRSV